MRQGFNLSDFADKYVYPLKNDEGWKPYRELNPQHVEKAEGLEPADDNHRFSAVSMTWRFMETLLTCYKIHDMLRRHDIVLCDGFYPTHDCYCDTIRVRNVDVTPCSPDT